MKKRLFGHFDSAMLSHICGMRNVSEIKLCILYKSTTVFVLNT